MADIELVIKIPEDIYNDICESGLEREFIWDEDKEVVIRAVKSGAPLPKGHGDLKDANKLKNAFISWSKAVQGIFTDVDIARIIYNSKTIIEADKAEKEN